MAIEIWVRVRVSNPTNLKRFFEVDALVDNGSTDSAMAGKLLRGVGISPLGRKPYDIWGPKTIRKQWGEARFQIGREFRTCTVTFEPEGEIPTIGATTLENLGYNIDMMGGSLTPARRRSRPGGRRRATRPLPRRR